MALAACRDADQGQPFRVLTADAAREIEAVAARVIPSDDGTPGAREAGVIRFIDRALEGFAAWARESVETGVGELAKAARPHGDRFSDLAAAEQDTVLASIEDGDFFQNVRLLTVLGMFADPRHGGNRDKTGWSLLGYVDRAAWQAPFGWYDERYAANGGDASAVGEDEPVATDRRELT